MPSVTKWLPPQNAFLQRPPSPLRPTAFEAIDDVPPPSHDAHFQKESGSRGTNNIQGLGVLYDGELEYDDCIGGSAQLSYSIDGRAYLARTPPAPAGSYARPVDQTYHWNHSQSPYNSSSKRKRTQGHTRSHSAMDDLANAAIAGGSPTSPFHSRPATSYVDSHSFENYDRPSKRVKSDRIPQSAWEPQESRPQTSQLDPAQQAEAELLLHFSTHVHKSPPAQHNQYQSPPAMRGSSVAFEYPPTNGITFRETDLEQRSALWQQHSVKLNGLQTSPSEHLPKEDFVNLQKEIKHGIEGSGTLLATGHDSALLSGSDNGRSTPPSREPKKPRRVKPEVQQSSCAVCERMQSVNANNDETFANNWISCNGCEKWYHSACVGFKDKREVQSVDKFICDICQPVHGDTTFVRKSSRARTAIDYAGLNQGLVKSSKETSLHHYVQPIKDGSFKFEPDRFARMRPELVTAEHFEKAGGMKEPFVVPAAWNPRFGDDSPYQRDDAIEDVEMTAGCEAVGADGTTRILTNKTELVHEEVVDCDQDLLDMVMPRDLTVRKVADLCGPSEHIPVIDVKTQNSLAKSWTLKRWADYYEALGEKAVCNVISLEISHNPLGRLVRRPKIVRDLDLQDSVWPPEMGNRKMVAFYCLMSVADSYTDFHIDFGGSSVYYHILKGRKTFFFIPPEDKNLKKYSEWCNSDTQNETFLGDLTGDCIRVDLYPGDTAFIPAGWIHAVWTPEDSLVIGGNFLTRLHYEAQLKVVNVERDTKVQMKFKYPAFQKVMWLTLLKYLEDDPLPEEVKDDFIDDPEYVFRRADPVWHEFGPLSNDKEPGDEYYNARYYSKAEVDGLVPLRDYLYRTALIASNMEVEGVTKDARSRVMASIPKIAQLDPLSYARTFGIWCAWKIGNTTSPEWTRSADGEIPLSIEAKPVKAWPDRVPPERYSKRVASLSGSQHGLTATSMKEVARTSPSLDFSTPTAPRPSSTSKSSGLGPKRVACEPCRKRRIKCRHKEEGDPPMTPTVGGNFPRPRALSSVGNDLASPNLLPGVEGPVSAQPSHRVRSTSLNLSADTPQVSSLFSERFSSPADGSGMSSGKKGRSKACEECRKSKRRCVHDENGKVDPAKSAEPTRPRGSATSKRPARVSNDFETNSKRPKTSASNDLDGLIDPALTSSFLPQQQAQPEPSLQDASRLMQSAADAIRLSTSEMNNVYGGTFFHPGQKVAPSVNLDPRNQFERIPSPNDLDVKAEHESPMLQHSSTQLSNGTLVSPPDSTGDGVDFPGTANEGAQSATSPDGGDSTSLDHGGHIVTPSSASRHSSRQPKSVVRYVPDSFATKASSSKRSEEGNFQMHERRASSSAASTLTAVTDPSRRPSSNTSAMGDGSVAPMRKSSIEIKIPSARAASTDSVAVIDDADERLARELHAQWNGSVRRSTRP